MQQLSATEAQASEVRLVGRLVMELESVSAWLQPHFRRREAHVTAVEYLKTLLGRAQRKNLWGLSEDAGHRAPYAFQHLLLRAKWDADAVRDDVLEYARRALGEGGILTVDETGFLKKGEKSVGVARQNTGTAGKVENAQVGVFFSYVTPLAHALVDGELYLPEPWTEDAARRQAGGIPDEVGFESKPAMAQGMLQRALGAGLKPAWVVGDEVYGHDSTLSPLPRRLAPTLRAGGGLQHALLARLLLGEAGRHGARSPVGRLGATVRGRGRQRPTPLRLGAHAAQPAPGPVSVAAVSQRPRGPEGSPHLTS
ncbi:IS701 family transposase [Corallococcus sp. AB050B]|nr:IS701 family transposase [Corallococcus sp. AB050B]